jgi:pectinesterase
LKTKIYIAFFICLLTSGFEPLFAQITVAQNGKGDFKSIQEAINQIAQTADKQRIITIKKGIYQEKIFIEKEKITLKGENVQETILKISEAREIWRCSNSDDWGTATVNIRANDITLENLTIINEYGFLAKGDSSVKCPNDSNKIRLIKKDSHQMAVRVMPPATRLIFKNCIFKSGGGDTVSPWDTENGMYFFQNCTFEGGVDLYCPRGWAYAENCKFICHSKSAGIWHDGSANKKARTVLKNCTFEGDEGFKLGRYHREAQFYLLNCTFSKEMANAPIYWESKAPNPILWGERIYYYNCHRKRGNYAWHQDNLPKEIDPKQIDFDWTFEGKWKLLNK